MPLNCALKIIKKVNSILCVFYHNYIYIYIYIYVGVFCFLGLHPQLMEVPSLGVQSEL